MAGKYRIRQNVQAFRMTAERLEDNSEWPGWAHEAWNRSPSEEGALFRDLDSYEEAGGRKRGIFVRIDGQQHLIKPGEWLIKSGDIVAPLPDHAFRFLYEEI